MSGGEGGAGGVLGGDAEKNLNLKMCLHITIKLMSGMEGGGGVYTRLRGGLRKA